MGIWGCFFDCENRCNILEQQQKPIQLRTKIEVICSWADKCYGNEICLNQIKHFLIIAV